VRCTDPAVSSIRYPLAPGTELHENVGASMNRREARFQLVSLIDAAGADDDPAGAADAVAIGAAEGAAVVGPGAGEEGAAACERPEQPSAERRARGARFRYTKRRFIGMTVS
jgi:hypothetical protein